jgi:hypothetical protein
MVKLNVSQKVVTIKTSWTEVTAADLLGIKRDNPRAVIEALSTLTGEEVRALDSGQVLALYELVSFIDDLEDLAANVAPGVELPDVDIAGGTYERAEVGRLRLTDYKKPYLLFPALVKVYYPDRLQDFTAVELMALGALIFAELTKLFERFKDLKGEPPTEDQEEAGISALHTFGTYAIVEGVASRYGCKPYDVYQWAAEEVYIDLLYQQTKAAYQENLRNIERRKSGGKK